MFDCPPLSGIVVSTVKFLQKWFPALHRWCSVFNADLALSVTMTAISTILSIAILPLNLLLYTKYSYDDDVISKLDWPSLFTALSIVILAIAIGLYCSYKIKSFEFNKRANQLGNASGLALIAFSALVTNTGDADSKIWSREWSFYVGVAGACILGLIIANVIGTMCNLKKPERVTVAVECCYQVSYDIGADAERIDPA